jgi:hypothetical protein
VQAETNSLDQPAKRIATGSAETPFNSAACDDFGIDRV